jgi:sec-independent protein translocase protein TatA
MFGLGTGEIAGIMVIMLLLFGAKKLPELARGLGQGIGEFRRSLTNPFDISQPDATKSDLHSSEKHV